MTKHDSRKVKHETEPFSPDIALNRLLLALNRKNSRERRSYFFAPEIFGAAAWDMLPALHIARGRGYSLRNLRLLLRITRASTALRWLDFLERSDLVKQQESPFDRRTVLLDLRAKAMAQMNDHFASVSGQLAHFGAGQTNSQNSLIGSVALGARA